MRWEDIHSGYISIFDQFAILLNCDHVQQTAMQFNQLSLEALKVFTYTGIHVYTRAQYYLISAIEHTVTIWPVFTLVAEFNSVLAGDPHLHKFCT